MQKITNKTLAGFCRENIEEDAIAKAFQIFHHTPDDATVCKKGSRSLVVKSSFAKQTVIFKYYYKRSLHHRLKYSLTQSRARQAWYGSHLLETAGIDAAKPILFLEEQPLKIPARALTIIEHIAGTPLDALMESQTLHSKQIRTIAQHLTNAFHQMYLHQITHGDLKASNIIVTPDLIPKFIDFDGTIAHAKKSSFLKALKSDRDRFFKNWQTHPELSDLFRDVFDKI